jgi:GTP-binding protein
VPGVVSAPLIAILGAPNVGKSTLFNRLVGRRRALVTDEPGVTRDRIYGTVEGPGRPFRIVDTGGLTPGLELPFAREIERQADAALADAAGILYVVDARQGASALDRDIVGRLRRRGVPVRLVANKVDAPSAEPLVHELHALGLGEPIAISAEHGLGLDRLLAEVQAMLGPETQPGVEPLGAGEEPQAAEARPVRVALVGRPNVGKSSLVNRLLGEERVLVSEVPGTTRDAVDTPFRYGGREYVLVDTAGIRRRGKVRQTAETLSVMAARRSIERADVVVLVVDATEPFAAQDAHIAGYATGAHRPVVVAVNKWDLVESREVAAKAWQEELRRRLRFVKEVPIVLVSARTGQRVLRILEHVLALHEDAGRRVPTPELNRWLHAEAQAERGSPAGGRSVKLFYAAQVGVHPPRFVLFCSDARRVHFSLRRRLENSLRERFGFGAAPLQLQFRSRREPADR